MNNFNLVGGDLFPGRVSFSVSGDGLFSGSVGPLSVANNFHLTGGDLFPGSVRLSDQIIFISNVSDS